MQEHVLAYFNVDEDGNCGFRAVAVSVEKSEECWVDVRKIIYNDFVTENLIICSYFWKEKRSITKYYL